MGGGDERVTVVMISYQRQALVPPAVERLLALPERPPVIVVDNASDPPATVPRQRQVRLVRLRGNTGAAARTVGVCAATTPYVAFCDDDSSWAPGALARAADHLDRDRTLALVAARLLVDGGREDPVVAAMRRAAIGHEAGLPRVLGFLACAVVVRRDAYLGAGGFHPRFLVGGEETLLACDLAAAGWRLGYVDDAVALHWPGGLERPGRSSRQVRNDCWTAWLRRPWPRALRHTAAAARAGLTDRTARQGLVAAVAGLPWVLTERRVLPPGVEVALRRLEARPATAPGAGTGQPAAGVEATATPGAAA